MRVAVLANGPSLPRHWRNCEFDFFDCVIAINTAAWKYNCDWAAYLDPSVAEGLAKNAPQPQRGFITPKDIELPYKVAGKRHEPRLYNHRADEVGLSEEAIYYTRVKQCNYTFPCALFEVPVIAPDATEVVICGMDCSVDKRLHGEQPEGTGLDVAGKTGDRTPRRWHKELPWVRAVWQPHWKVRGDVSPAILAWIRGDTPWDALEAIIE